MNQRVEKFAPWQQRVALTEFADEGMSYLETAAGAAFMEQLDHHIAPSIVAFAHSWGYAIERQDVTHLVIERFQTTLRQNPERSPIRYAATADNPWGYVADCARRWVRQERGVKCVDIEYAETLAVDSPASEESHLTPLDEVIRLCFEQLAPRTPTAHHPALLELLGWLAANTPQRLTYEGFECQAAHRHCPSLTLEQVTAVMNIARGGRPRQAETSLMGQYLLDSNFRPPESPSHARALTYFKAAFSAGEQGSRMLTDWNAA